MPTPIGALIVPATISSSEAKLLGNSFIAGMSCFVSTLRFWLQCLSAVVVTATRLFLPRHIICQLGLSLNLGMGKTWLFLCVQPG
jgi:hypothetical protein